MRAAGRVDVMKIKTKSLAVAAIAEVFLFGATALASAQSDAARAIYVSAATVPTATAGVSTYPAPSAAFSPLTASDEELATYGFPPRPNQQTDANHYEIWARAMTAAKIRATGEIKPVASLPHQGMARERIGSSRSAPSFTPPTAQPPTSRLAAVPATATPAITGPKLINSSSWSGVASTNTLTKWNAKSSFGDVWGSFTIPYAQDPFGACDGDSHDATAWIGIDGFAHGYGEQALGGGILIEAFCGEVPFYPAIFAWYPDVSVTEAGFNARAGDLMYVETYAVEGGGAVFLEDLSTLNYNTFTLSSSVPLVGDSVEWLLGTFSTTPFPNTTAMFFTGAEALTASGHSYYPGSASLSTEVFTLFDPSGTQAIEIVSAGTSGNQGKYTLFFQTTGCAYSGGC
jgi:Peptidase A4 family